MPPAHDSKRPEPEDQARQRQAAALNNLLGAIGLTTSEQTGWWNLTAFAELGGRTPTQPCLAGDTELVKSLVEGLVRSEREGGGAGGRDPEFLAMLLAKLAELESGRVNRSA